MKVLLAMDTSAASHAVLEEAIAKPWPANSCFEVVSVVEPPHMWIDSDVAVAAERCAQRVVGRAVERLRAANLEAGGMVLFGNPKTVILDRARTQCVDVVVVGSHGSSLAGRYLLGSVAASVLRYASCSVEVVRARSVKNPGNMKVLLATDGSEYSEAAARSIAQRRWPGGAEIEVLSVVELILPTARAFFEVPLIDNAFLESARAEAMQRSQNAIARAGEILAPTGLNVIESISVLAEPPKAVILTEASEWGADLVVLGSHGRHGVDRFLMGSVSEAVAMHAGCSVEVIRKAA